MRYLYGAVADIGTQRRLQEDYVVCKEYEKNEQDVDLLAIIADGSGTTDDRLQPANLAANAFLNSFEAIRNEKPEYFENDILYFMEKAMKDANNTIGLLKIANEELYNGYAAAMSVLYLTSDGRMYYTHAGNTRIYLMRNGQLIKLTEDQTRAQQRLDEGDQIEYYLSSDRLVLTNGIGLTSEPTLYSNYGTIKTNDIFIMTTDGIHYAVREEFFPTLVLEGADPANAAQNLVNGAKDTEYPDNLSAIVIAEQKIIGA